MDQQEQSRWERWEEWLWRQQGERWQRRVSLILWAVGFGVVVSAINERPSLWWRQQRLRWLRIRRLILWIVGAVVVVSAVIFVISRLFVDQPLWEWLKLLIVPAVLAGGGLWFNAQQREREQHIAHNRAQDETLQAYLDGIAELLTDKDQPLHSAQLGDSLSTVARARTLTVLGRLEGGRKRTVLQFLYESGLINKEQTILDQSDLIERRRPIVDLYQADLSEANLSRIYLPGLYLREVNLRWAILHHAWLEGADLRWVDLSGADLRRAILSGAILSGAILSGADLREVDLSGADLSEARAWRDLEEMLELNRTDLSGAKLNGAVLREARFESTILTGADLSGADLSGATLNRVNLERADLSGVLNWSPNQLRWAQTVESATMPDGKKLKSRFYPDRPTLEEWLNSKGSGEDGEGSGAE